MGDPPDGGTSNLGKAIGSTIPKCTLFMGGIPTINHMGDEHDIAANSHRDKLPEIKARTNPEDQVECHHAIVSIKGRTNIQEKIFGFDRKWRAMKSCCPVVFLF